jgi:hypothetical protein
MIVVVIGLMLLGLASNFLVDWLRFSSLVRKQKGRPDGGPRRANTDVESYRINFDLFSVAKLVFQIR